MNKLTLVAIGLLMVVPMASAVQVDGYLIAEGGVDGQTIMACTAPLFTNCSIAMATALGACKTFKHIGTFCIGGGFGAVGGLSSIAVQGGGAFGSVNDFQVFCNWPGASGGCIDEKGNFGFECVAITATGHGYLSLPGVADTSPLVDAIISLKGPVVTATAKPACSILDAASVQTGDVPANAPTPQEVEDGLKQAALEQLAHRPEITYLGDPPASLRLQAEAMQDQFFASIAAQVDAIEVTDDYQVLLG